MDPKLTALERAFRLAEVGGSRPYPDIGTALNVKTIRMISWKDRLSGGN